MKRRFEERARSVANENLELDGRVMINFRNSNDFSLLKIVICLICDKLETFDISSTKLSKNWLFVVKEKY